MPRFCANLSTLFADRPLLDRVGAARAAGFEAVEILFPYDDPAPRLLERLDAAGLPLALINCPPPNYTGGPRGFAAVPGLEDRFRNDLRRAARLAATLGAQHLHVMAGVAEGEDARRAFVENLRWAAAAAPRQRLTIEPLNGRDNPGYFLQSFDLACEVLDEVGAPTLGLQFDTHHAAAIEGDVHGAWARVARRVTHVQVAGAGRHEPDDPAFLLRLDRDGYGGWVSGEYAPKGRTEEGLGWMRPNASPA
jgi:hydroxypyruvate isomerase